MTPSPAEPSLDIKSRTVQARTIQTKRFAPTTLFANAQMSHKDIKTFCPLSAECRDLLKRAIEELKLSARAHDRIIKVARTIADLEKSPEIQPEHIAEAVQYRSLDRDGGP